jgi:hypothetical protein
VTDLTAAIDVFSGLTNAYRHRAEVRTRTNDLAGSEDDRRSHDRLGGCDLPSYE